MEANEGARPEPAESAPAGSGGPQDASQLSMPAAISRGDLALPALDVDTLARRAHERDCAARLMEAARRNAELWRG